MIKEFTTSKKMDSPSVMSSVSKISSDKKSQELLPNVKKPELRSEWSPEIII